MDKQDVRSWEVRHPPVNNPKEVDWDSFPPIRDILRQALSDGRLIDSMDHPLLKKLRGEIE